MLYPLLLGGLVAAGVYLLGKTVSASEIEALARVVQSEAGSHSTNVRMHIAWAVRNRARSRGKTVQAMVCTPTCGSCCTGRPFSSRQAPNAGNRAIAATVLAQPVSLDPTNGANSFVEPALQDQLVAQGYPGYTLTYAEVRARWIRGGQVPLYRLGVWEFWRTPPGH